jgi:hypothetical protein
VPNQIFPLGHPKSKGPESHVVSAREAASMVRSYHAELQAIGMDVDCFHSISYLWPALDKLKAIEGSEGIRISRAIHNGRHTLAIFAVDASGGIVGSVALENGEPCPPFCKPSPSQPE